MNCKPGDLAVIVRGRNIALPCLGRIVRVLSTVPSPYCGSPAWKLETPLQHPVEGTMAYILDECLRPIRDPGDDARDETLDWLPVPTKEIA
jgi:hypothetical protein